jgi:MSHA biogenesis protein MshI
MSVQRQKVGSGSVAICVHEDRADITRVSRPADGPPVIDVCASVRREGSDIETLVGLRRQYHLDRFSCVTLMPENGYQLQVIEAPSVPASELKAAVRWRIQDVLDYPADAATIDVFFVPADPNAPTRTRSIYAVAARNESITARMAMFFGAKVPLTTIDIPEMAQRNVAALFESPGTALAMLSLSEEGGLLTFTSNAELYMARSIDIGLTQLRTSEGTLREQLLARIVLEVQRSLDHFDRQFSFMPFGKLMLAPLPEGVDLLEYLVENLYVSVEHARLDSCIDMSRVPELSSPDMQSSQFMAIGAALRLETAS